MFGLLGDDTVALGAELTRLGIGFVAARHETHAVTMAEGYARVCGRVGVVINSRGPGFLNSLNALAAAANSRAPLLFLAGEAPTTVKATRQSDWKYVDQAAICELVGVRPLSPTRSGDVVPQLRSALAAAVHGAVAYLLASDLVDAQVGELPPADASPPTDPSPPLDQDIVTNVADVLQESWAASRPIIMAGRGALLSGAELHLRRLAELTGALLCTTMQARAMFRDDPYCVGVCGTASTPAASELIVGSDLMLTFGASLNKDTTLRGDLIQRSRVIQVDQDPAALGQFVEPAIAIEGDAAAVARALVAELESRDHQATGRRTDAVRATIASWVGKPLHPERSLPGLVDPRRALREIDRMLPEQRVVVIDGGHFMYWAFECLRVTRERGFLHPNSNWYSIGLGMGAAIGAAVAAPDHTTVLAIGDSGLMMSLGDLETAVRLSLPLLVVVCNDGAWGSEALILQTRNVSDTVARMSPPNLAGLADVMGAQSRMVDSVDSVLKLASEVNRVGRGPLLVDCRVNTAVPD